MATAAVTYTFAAGTTAASAEVNTNFANLVTFLNASVLHKDGSVAMSGGLDLPNAEPGSDNAAVRRKYVQPLQVAKLTSSYDLGTVSTFFYIPAAFTMPTVASPHCLAVEFYVPYVTATLDLGDTTTTIELQKTDGTVLQQQRHRYYTSPSMGGLFLRYVFVDNSSIAAGASAALRLRGQTDNSGIRLNGSSTTPIFYAVHWL